MSYEEIFRLYQACQRNPGNAPAMEALIKGLLPYVDLWAKDVLIDAPSRVKYNWRDDVIGAGSSKLFRRTLKLLDRHVADGKHLVDTLRISVTNAMRRTLHRRFVVPFVTPETVSKRLKKGKRAYRSWELRKQVDLDFVSSQLEVIETNRVTPLDRRFFAPDDLPEKAREFKRLICEAASALSHRWGWPYAEFVYGFQLSVSKVAKWTETPESTLRGRLRRVGREIAVTAPFEVYQQGKIFLGKRWASAAQNDAGWQRNGRGGFDDWTPWVRLPVSDASVIGFSVRYSTVDATADGQGNDGASDGLPDRPQPKQAPEGGTPIVALSESGKAGGKISKKLRFDPAENVLARQRNIGRVGSGNSRRALRRRQTATAAPAADLVLYGGWSLPDPTVSS